MPKDEYNLLNVLKAELTFLLDGNYRHARKNAWRPQLIFEDSPTCLNYDVPEKPADCTHCPLMQFVPPGLHSERAPCRHIPLNADGEALETLYESADQGEIEAKVAGWLRSATRKLEEEQARGSKQHRLSKGAGK